MGETIYSALKKEIEISRNMQVNSEVDMEKRLIGIENKIDGVANSIEKLMSMTEASKQTIYTDRELFELKEELSWAQLHKKTNIPLSTLQCRVRRYKKANDLY